MENTSLITTYRKATAFTAAVTSANIESIYNKTPNPTDQLKIDWKHHLDGCATTAMEQSLNSIPFESISVGSEGKKEADKVGIAAPCLKNQTYGKNGKAQIIIMTDVLEGTTFASSNKPGASSVLAGYQREANEFGIKASEKGLNYLYKFFGPSQINGVVDPLISHTKNLKNILEALNLKNPHDLIQITLDPNMSGRSCNFEVVKQADDLGIDVRLIKHGDFIAGLRALSQPQHGQKYAIVVGRGGYEEGIMNVVAAKVLGGFSQIQEFNSVTKTVSSKILDTNTLMSSNYKQAFVLNSFITDENLWFKKPGVKLIDNQYLVTSLIINNQKLDFQTDLFSQDLIEDFIFPYGTF